MSGCCAATPFGDALPDNLLMGSLSAYLLGTCLLKTVVCCVRVSNHVPCRRVALLAPRSAGRGAGADVVRLCRLQRRHVDACVAKLLPNPFGSQPEATGSVPAPQVERRELPQYARPQPAYRSSAPPPIAAPQSYPAAWPACPEAGAGSRPTRRRRAPARNHRERCAAFCRCDPSCRRDAGTTIIVGTSDTLDILARRYNVTSAAILQANGYKGPARAVARPAADHSAPGRGCGGRAVRWRR